MFIANRGEIAVRIIKTCHKMNIETVVGVSEADKDTMAAKLSDHVICIGPSTVSQSYLNSNAIITAALSSKCDAIHPGYGFLSENADFAKLCDENNLIFIGPSSENIRKMGNKLEARKLAKSAGVPLAEGSEHVSSVNDAYEIVNKVGYPLLIKAASGGGGRGIRIVREESELKQAFENASAEAQSAFNDKKLYIEHYIDNARHIEVQVLSDHHGNVIHLGDRDCSMQRRYQKVIEEAPACNLPDNLRKGILNSAVKLTKSIGYRNAGTVEFIYDVDLERYFFLEMNTRLQVEHPVTEEVTGIDIVEEQLRIASNEKLCYSQDDIKILGHAIECRINAESAANGFRPTPGKITKWMPPIHDRVRLDTHCYDGYVVSPYYDSLMGKLISSSEKRDDSINLMQNALEGFIVEGIETNINFLSYVINQDKFKNYFITTQLLEDLEVSFANKFNQEIKN